MTRIMRMIALALTLSVGLLVLAPTVATAGPRVEGDIDITGAVKDADGNESELEGTVTDLEFRNQGGQLLASGTVVDDSGTVLAHFVDEAVTVQQTECDILTLVLGPLDLDLLGLEVFLDTVTLEITAVPGPGNLLGNLLCAIAGLLDGGGPLGAIAGLLNRILDLLSDLLG